MHIFITGGAGFIGSQTAEALLQRGDSVSVIDLFDFGYDPRRKEDNIRILSQYPQFRLYRGDIRDRNLLRRIFQEQKPDVVVHLAARAGVRPSLEEPASYMDINITGTVEILETMKEFGCDRMVFASSSSVYGSRKQGPFRETDNVDIPASPYAATKRAGEIICANYHYLYNMQCTCLRFFTVYGPRQRPEMAIHLFADKISKGERITMFGDGSSIRDYTFVEDIVTGVIASIDTPLGYEIINLGNSSPIRLDALIQKIAVSLGTTANIIQLPDQPGDVPLTYADVSKAKQLLRYAPDTPLDVGLARFVQWYTTYTPSDS
jgi:UDP-glucuronate 4-epimerase